MIEKIGGLKHTIFHTCTKNLTEISVYKVMNNNGQQKEKRKRLEKETGRGFFLFSPSLQISRYTHQTYRHQPNYLLYQMLSRP